MAAEAAVKWFKEKAERKALKKLLSEVHELKVLKAKYQERPIPIERYVGNVPSERPYMSIPQMVRFQSLKLDYEYYPLRDQGMTHDEAEERVFPAAFAYRKKKEKEQIAFQNKDNLDKLEVDGLEVEVA